MRRRAPISTLFPYTTLFRSIGCSGTRAAIVLRRTGRPAGERTCSRVRSSRWTRSEEHTSELQSQFHLVCRLLLEKKKHTSVCHFSSQTLSSSTCIRWYPLEI